MHKDDRALLYELNKRVARGEKLNKQQMELHEYLANENLTGELFSSPAVWSVSLSPIVFSGIRSAAR
jgi:hypothetical protein